ncbi:MAG: hypothetical protein HQK83_03340 [Fibrobacteria bacterium]|nr:hypothetical protein [Fibrobacteria bacterium]
MNIVKKLVLIIFLGIFCFSLTSCAKTKGGASPGASDDAGSAASAEDTELDQAKQDAESAEWEAHRLREELHRKQQPQ